MPHKHKNAVFQHLGLVAGGGDLPTLLAQQATANGKALSIAALEPFSTQNWTPHAARKFKLNEISAICDYFKQAGVDAITFAGQVNRPDFSTFTPDNLSALTVRRLKNAAIKGDDALLRNVISIFENAGFPVVGIADIAPEYVIKEGVYGNQQACGNAQNDSTKACHIARQIGALDIGQGAVVCQGIVLAVEAQEGTHEMLLRCAQLPEALRGTRQHPRGVFAKWAKPGQDRRIDLPVVGTATLEAVSQAGLAGLVLEAGAVIILEPKTIFKTLEKLGLFIQAIKAKG
jgi:UDP-2,3-diacylglucosamine hydrolase